MNDPDRLDFQAPITVRVTAGRHAERVGEAVGMRHGPCRCADAALCKRGVADARRCNVFLVEVEFGGGYRAEFTLGQIEQLAPGRIGRGSDEERGAYARAAMRRKEFA